MRVTESRQNTWHGRRFGSTYPHPRTECPNTGRHANNPEIRAQYLFGHATLLCCHRCAFKPHTLSLRGINFSGCVEPGSIMKRRVIITINTSASWREVTQLSDIIKLINLSGTSGIFRQPLRKKQGLVTSMRNLKPIWVQKRPNFRLWEF